ncbi:MAG TPA: DUF6519 domain-containing protein [Longimicrobium sp.]|nr:DUF6519 domain-containing protein [Longimicrobium sp.]
MKGDFSRQTFDPQRHFSGVRMQQGRVQLDADWNEQVDLARHRVETGTLDQVGHCGGPLHDAGFRIVALSGAPQAIKDLVKAAHPAVDVDNTDDLVILPGRYYVDGLLVVCEAPVLFGSQPDLPEALPAVAQVPAHGLAVPGDYVLYLDVWDRHLTALEDPSLRERALGGPDTATRTRTVWQVRALPYTPAGGGECDEPAEWAAKFTEAQRALRARSQPDPADQGPCVVPAGAGYRGLENQLYRVEIHAPGAQDAGGAGVAVNAVNSQNVLTVAGGSWDVGDTVLLYPTVSGGLLRPTLAQISATAAGDTQLTLTADFELSVADDKPELRKITGATWKWSRDNGIAVSRVTGLSLDGLRVTVDSLGADEVLGFRKGDWVELTDDWTELNGLPGWLAMVDKPDHAAREVVLRTPFPGLAANMLDLAKRTPRLRRWDGLGVVGPGAQTGGYHALEDGVEVAFGGGPFTSGDWWTIPARTATAENEEGGNVEWPLESTGQGVARPPMGIHHHRCRIGTVNVKAGSAPKVTDCRCLFPPLTEVRTLAYVGGAGQEAMPDFSSATEKPVLELPLVVGVGNGHCRTDGRVRFKVEIGGGDVSPWVGAPAWNSVEKIVDIESDGTARCRWRLGRADYAQQVSATLQERVYQHPTDAGKDIWIDVPGPILFNASLSIADEVGYQPDPNCTPLAKQYTVQDAITHLSRLVSLHSAGGDGQEARPGNELPCKLAVLASSACGPVPNAQVKFTVEGGGTLLDADAQTGADGIARVRWQLGASGCQQVTAVIQGDPGTLAEPRTVVFNASLDTAGGGCEVTVGPGGDFPTLEAALEQLNDRRGMCICLLPGRHKVDGPLEYNLSGASLCIRACGGPGTRIELRGGHLQFNGLESFILRDLDLVADQVEGPLLLTNCEEVVIENCRIGQSDLDTPLLTVAGAERLRVQGCTLWSLFGGTYEDSDKADDTALDAPLRLMREVTGRAPTIQGGFRTRVHRWFSVLVRDRYAVRERLKAPVESAETTEAAEDYGWQEGTVLQLPYGQGTVTLEDNLILGYVHLYGSEGELPWEEVRQLGAEVSQERLVVGLEGGHLSLRGNQLMGLRVDRQALSRRRPPRPEEGEKWPVLDGTFRFCTLTDNRFVRPGSTVLAAHLRVSSNQFDMGDEEVQSDLNLGANANLYATTVTPALALVGVSRSATAVGNVAGEETDNPLVHLAVSNSRGDQAANVPPVLIY